MIDRGEGPPLVLVPGIQGRWEWMEPAVNALARRFRVLTSSLPGEPGSEVAGGGHTGFDAQALVVDRLIERAGVGHAVVLGVSFGGLVAAYAAATRPGRVTALVLASTPGPDWRADARIRRYMTAPRLMAPVFVAGAPMRLGPEIRAAHEGTGARIRFAWNQARRVVKAPLRPSLAGARLRLMAGADMAGWCPRISAPTLVITGEPHLDHVVPVSGSRKLAEVIHGARLVELPRTGHLGCVTRPDPFAGLVWEFVSSLEAR